MATVTQRRAEKVLAQVKEVFAPWVEDGDGPTLNMEWDWPSSGPTPTILWEGGPYDWAMLFPHGGRAEFGFKVKEVTLPKGIFAEPYSGWALCLYPDD